MLTTLSPFFTRTSFSFTPLPPVVVPTTTTATVTLTARLNGTNGSFDPAFGSGGQLPTQLGTGSDPSSSVEALALQPDGKVLLPGVISHATNVIEHPEYVAERILRCAR